MTRRMQKRDTNWKKALTVWFEVGPHTMLLGYGHWIPRDASQLACWQQHSRQSCLWSLLCHCGRISKMKCSRLWPMKKNWQQLLICHHTLTPCDTTTQNFTESSYKYLLMATTSLSGWMSVWMPKYRTCSYSRACSNRCAPLILHCCDIFLGCQKHAR